MKSVVDGLIFDLDNTLFDRQATFVKVADSFYEEFLSGGGSTTREDAVAMMVQSDDDGYAGMNAKLTIWLNEWPDLGLDMETLAVWYRSTMKRHVQPDLEVNGFLADLNEQGVPWGIVTNGSSRQHGKCEAAGLAELARFVIVSEEAGYAKPDPRIFDDALEAIGLSSQERIMFVGDHALNDIDGAKRFGMKAAWVHRDQEYPEGLMPPDHVIDRVTDVRQIIEFAT